MSQTLLLSGVDRISSSVLNLHYSPDAPLVDHLSHLSQKHSPWTSHSPSMMENAQSFTARRPAATNLPQFSLPPPDHLHQKYPAYAPSHHPGPVVNSIPTPPTGLSNSDLSPLASSENSNGSNSSSNSGPSYPQPNNPIGYWPTPGNPHPASSYSYSAAPPLATSYAQSQSFMGRAIYSPSSNQFSSRSASSPTAGGEGLPPPPFEMGGLPPFPTSMSSGGGGGQHQQQQQQQTSPSQAQQPPQQHQSQHMANNHGLQTSQPPQASPLHAPENYGPRPPPTPTYYTPTSTPQQSSFPAFHPHPQQSPTQHSPNSSGAPQNRISPISAHPMQPPPQSFQPRLYSGYTMPPMSGPIMSNVHNPGTQMALVGGGNMQLQYPPHQLGGHVYGQQPPQNDRPFKCDQCPQSFNRNHDLKRHKRIHLAVKPFPCGHCEKSFSRKDALKRHMLVKGCGSAAVNNKLSSPDDSSQSPRDRSELMSDSTDDTSPHMMKKEL